MPSTRLKKQKGCYQSAPELLPEDLNEEARGIGCLRHLHVRWKRRDAMTDHDPMARRKRSPPRDQSLPAHLVAPPLLPLLGVDSGD